MAAFMVPDRLLVVIDVNDPLTKDKEFYLSLKYSPFVNGLDEMSERNRRQILKRDKHKDAAEDVLVRKFVIDVDPDYIGDFILQFVANPEAQRQFNFVDFGMGPLLPHDVEPEEVIAEALHEARNNGTLINARAEGKDLDEVVKQVIEEHMNEYEEGLTHTFELRSGEKIEDSPMIRMLNDENPYDTSDDEDQDEDGNDPEDKSEDELPKSGDPDGESQMEDDSEDLEMEGNVFVIKPTTRTVH
jgi:hypothetical protein